VFRVAQVDEFEDRVIFGEIYAPLDDLMKYYGALNFVKS